MKTKQKDEQLYDSVQSISVKLDGSGEHNLIFNLYSGDKLYLMIPFHLLSETLTEIHRLKLVRSSTIIGDLGRKLHEREALN